MNILVTGAEGFIGKKLVKSLKEAGHNVIMHCYADGDISQKDGLKRYEDRNIDVIYHLAARTFVPDSWNDTYEYFQTNMMGTIAVLEFCRKQHCAAVLMSTYVYGEPKFLPVSEKHPTVAITPYHETKILLEDIGRFYADKFQIPVTVFRPFNVYGAGQNENFLLPKIMKQILDESISEIRLMDLKPKRDYVYIDDVVEIMLCALQVKEGFNVYNIGTGKSYSVEEALNICMDVTGIHKAYCATNEVRTQEVSDCVADMSKVCKAFNYEIKYSLPEGIRKWYEELNSL